MCTLAGYIGTKPAAPELLRAARRQEGWWSGFYSGLATAAPNRLHWAKAIGTIAKLERTTPARELPGTVGLVHSRTKSGGGREWGHPFVSQDGAVACVAQGSHGVFADNAPRVALGNRLLAAGWRLRSSAPGPIGSYPTLGDGSAVHTSELATIAVAAEYAAGGDAAAAIREAMARIPSEAILLFLFRDCPDRIFVANVSQRLVLARNSAGTYLASAITALPDDAHWHAEVPGNTLAVVTRDAVRCEPLLPPGAIDVLEATLPGLDTAVLAFLRQTPGRALGAVSAAVVEPHLPADRIVRRSAAIYGAVERLLAAGLVRASVTHVPGVIEGETAPCTVFSVVT